MLEKHKQNREDDSEVPSKGRELAKLSQVIRDLERLNNIQELHNINIVKDKIICSQIRGTIESSKWCKLWRGLEFANSGEGQISYDYMD